MTTGTFLKFGSAFHLAEHFQTRPLRIFKSSRNHGGRPSDGLAKFAASIKVIRASEPSWAMMTSLAKVVLSRPFRVSSNLFPLSSTRGCV